MTTDRRDAISSPEPGVPSPDAILDVSVSKTAKEKEADRRAGKEALEPEERLREAVLDLDGELWYKRPAASDHDDPEYHLRIAPNRVIVFVQHGAQADVVTQMHCHVNYRSHPNFTHVAGRL